MNNKNHVLVTGGAGFIGSNIAIQLVKDGYQVTVLDDLSTGYLKNLDTIKDKIKFIQGSITDYDLLNKIMPGVDFVLHQAALPSVPRSIDSPIDSHANNATGILNILEAARLNKVKRVVFASSSSVYGDAPEEYKSEDLPTNPLSPYAVTKLVGEEYCRVFAELYDIETVCLRYFNVFGPQQDPASDYAAVIPLFIKAILADQQPTIFGDGTQSRDFTYVNNNVKANILAMHSDKVGRGETINIACGQAFSLLDLVNDINKILNKNIKPILADPRAGDIKHSLANISKAKELLDYKTDIDFIQGLKLTIDWMKEQS
jgi:nucleoside-diphosphate-sugar epimerase